MQIIVRKQHGTVDLQDDRTVISNYKLTMFCVSVKIDEGVLLCNTATGELVLINSYEYSLICSKASLKGKWAKTLTELMFLVDEDLDECIKVDNERSKQFTLSQSEITSFTILPTTDCNARCFYCYEKGIRPQYMTTKTALDVAEFINKVCGGKKVQLSWFGGEPTIAHPIITQICNSLKKYNITYCSSMISNGLYLDKELVRVAYRQWNLERVQITLDGTERIYNSVKNYKDKVDNPFKMVLSNVEDLLEQGICVSIRINLGMHNHDDVAELIRELTLHFSGNKFIKIYVHEIDNYYDSSDYINLRDEATSFNMKLTDAHMRPMDELPSIKLHSCMADSGTSLLINPNGQLGKCEHYIYEKLCGSIYCSERNDRILEEWREQVRFDRCNQCAFYASCIRLKWCNGGSTVCDEAVINDKIRITKDTMLRLYRNWKDKRFKVRRVYNYVVTFQLEIVRNTKGWMANFYYKENAELFKAIPVNATGVDILSFLQQRHTFSEILDMLYINYGVSEECVKDDVEEYILYLIREELILCIE